MIEPMMTPHEVAKYVAEKCAVSERNVYDRWIHLAGFPKGRLIPTMGKRARKRYIKSEVDQWLEKRKKDCDKK